MKKRTVRLPRSNEGGMPLDIASYGRRGPGRRSLSRADVEHVSLAVRRVPEVMIKVSGGGGPGTCTRWGEGRAGPGRAPRDSQSGG